MPMSLILGVDDEPQRLEVMSEMLKLEVHCVPQVENGKQVIEQVEAEPFDRVTTDLIMPEKEGLLITAVADLLNA